MNILVQLSHPAHFHLYRNAIKNWQSHGHKVFVLIKTKDILEELCQKSGIKYYNILPVAHRKNKFGILMDMFIRDWKILKFCIKHKIDILTGCTAEIAQVAWLLHRYEVNTGEDDLSVVPTFKFFCQPFVQVLLSPEVCDISSIGDKGVLYNSYHELAYLHPNHFTPSKDVVREAGIDPDEPFFILRFASLTAHHDKGIQGINTEIAQRLVDMLKPHGRIYITSERPLEPQFDEYRIKINPLDIHHVMAFVALYIGDSQTMAAEAGVLGVPFVRFNDFVGRIGYLRELEDKYQLGIGVKASDSVNGGKEKLYAAVQSLLDMPNRKAVFAERRERMLSEKIDYAKFLTWFVEEYPESKKIMQENPDYQYRFR